MIISAVQRLARKRSSEALECDSGGGGIVFISSGRSCYRRHEVFSFHLRVSCVGTKLHPSQHRKHKLQPWQIMNHGHGSGRQHSNDTSKRASRTVLCINIQMVNTNGFDARFVMSTFTTLSISVQGHTSPKSIGGEWSNVQPLLAVLRVLAVLHLMQVL